MTTEELTATLTMIGDLETNQLTAFGMFLAQDISGTLIGATAFLTTMYLIYRAVNNMIALAGEDSKLKKLRDEMRIGRAGEITHEEYQAMLNFVYQHRGNNHANNQRTNR